MATLNLPADYLAAASGGTKAKSGTLENTSADATGTAAHWRLYASDRTTCGAQGAVTATGGGGGSLLYRQKHHRADKDFNALLDKVAAEVLYGEIIETAYPTEVKQAKAVVKPFREAKAVDWSALDADAAATAKLVALWIKIADRKQQIRQDEEFWFLMVE